MSNLWKTVRIFVSSTFADLQAERDWLVKRVFPALRQRLEPKRIHLVDIDLRWGITRRQAENDQVLGLCLQQIDECRPFFLGLLGGRYAWVPSRLLSLVDGLFKVPYGNHRSSIISTRRFLRRPSWVSLEPIGSDSPFPS